MSTVGSCIYKYLSGIHLFTLKVSGSNPRGDRNKKISAVAKED
jgi:hypothetical protein